MQRLTGSIFCLTICLVISGCGQSAYQANADFAEESIAVMDLYSDALESVKDKETAKAAAVKIKEANGRMEKLLETKDDIPKVGKSDKEKLDKEYMPKMKAAIARMQKAGFSAGFKSGAEPTFMAAIKEMKALGERFAN
jgi:hypothetical protein